MRQSPVIAVVLMIEEDHLDVHGSFEEYLDAKANIAKYQQRSDTIIYHPTNQFSAQIALQSSAQKKLRYGTSEAAWVNSGQITMNEQIICSLSDIQLIGPHNLENICAAVTAAWQISQQADRFREAISGFKGLEHRLQKVAEVGGVEFYDDSISTNPSSAIAALKSFNQPLTIILGGSDKRADYQALAETLPLSSAKKAILVGQTAAAIAVALRQAGWNKFQISSAKAMAEIVKEAWTFAQPGEIILLSPACASFDMFKDYKDRGQQFQQAAQRLLDER